MSVGAARGVLFSHRRALAIHGGAWALYIAFGVLYTWPVARDLGGQLLGFPGDNLGGVHTLWWDWHTLSTGELPWSIELFAYPFSQVVLHPSPLMEALSLPLTGLFGAVAASNLLVIGSFAATGYCTFLLCRWLTGSVPASLAGGLLFTGTGAHQFDYLWNTNAVFALPLTVLALLAWRRRPERWPLVALAGIALALSNFYYGAYFLPVLALVFAPWRSLRDVRRVSSYVAAFATTLLVSLVVYLPPLLASGEGTIDQLRSVAQAPGSRPPTELAATVIGAPTHPLIGDWFAALGSGLDPMQAPNVGSAYVGLIVLVLAVIGWRSGRRTGPWVPLGLVGLVMMLGPRLRVGGHDLFPLPYAAFVELPGIGFLRAPGRFYYLLALALVVLAAFGLVAIGRRSARLAIPAIAALTALALFGTLFRFPQPVTATAAPAVYERLADLPDEPALIEVPGGGFNDYQWLAYQRVSELPIVNNPAPRPSTASLSLLRENAFLQSGIAGPVPGLSIPPAEIGSSAPASPARRAGVGELARLGVGYLILHKRTIFGWASPADPGYANYRVFIERHLGAPAYEDGEVALYALPGAPGLAWVRSWAAPGDASGQAASRE